MRFWCLGGGGGWGTQKMRPGGWDKGGGGWGTQKMWGESLFWCFQGLKHDSAAVGGGGGGGGGAHRENHRFGVGLGGDGAGLGLGHAENGGESLF